MATTDPLCYNSLRVNPVRRLLLLLLLLPGVCAPALPLLGLTPAETRFLDRVQPLLQSKCVACHNDQKQKGGLRLDSREAILKGGDSGPAAVPGQPAASLLVQAVLHTKPDLEMPPKEKLTPADTALLERWVRDGLPWPRSPAPAHAAGTAAAGSGERLGDAWSDERNPVRRIWGGQRLDLWSVRPLQPLAPPRLKSPHPDAYRNPIDRFVDARLKEKGLAPSPEADRRTLVRRLYFGLTGLPPTPEEVAAFLADPAPDAYERLVDQLLASPRYGEHQARLWLDVIRYSDSNGFDWDEFRPRAWRFRDYAVRSFNADKPFDQFIREQLAGDELVPGAPRSPAEQDAWIATGYLRLGPHDNSAALFGEEGKVRHALLTDLVETTGAAFLGLTFSCCRCHDHKYDPLTQADHYRLRAFFEPVRFADDVPLDLAPDQDAIRRHNAAIDAQVQPIRARIDALHARTKERLLETRRAELPEADRLLLSLPKDRQPADVQERIATLEKKITPSEKEILAALSPEDKKQADQGSEAIETLNRRKQQFLLGLLMTDKPDGVPATRILAGGDPAEPRDPVEPGFPSLLDPNPAPIRKGANPATTGRRLALADWIASPSNPLTARVLVNRIWQQHFGNGLVGTPNDFGLAGSRPTHPELLDWLATDFIRSGWSLKSLHRRILTSTTYRQTATVDPSHPAVAVDADNSLLWRQNPRRLSAEQLRDNLLAVAGRLTDRAGGPPAWPELPPEILQANPAFLDDNAEKTKGWYPSPPGRRDVRTLYLVQKRTVRVPFLETFDLPENSTPCARRNVSTVAPQALTLLNDSQILALASSAAARLDREAGPGCPPPRLIERAFALTLQRPPSPRELDACTAFLQQRSLPELCRALFNLNEFVYLD